MNWFLILLKEPSGFITPGWMNFKKWSLDKVEKF